MRSNYDLDAILHRHPSVDPLVSVPSLVLRVAVFCEFNITSYYEYNANELNAKAGYV